MCILPCFFVFVIFEHVEESIDYRVAQKNHVNLSNSTCSALQILNDTNTTHSRNTNGTHCLVMCLLARPKKNKLK